jgi:hypothetical protein
MDVLDEQKKKHELYVKPFEDEWKLWGDRQFEIIKIYITQSFTICWAAIVGYVGLCVANKNLLKDIGYEPIIFFGMALIFVSIATYFIQMSLGYFSQFSEDEANKWNLIQFGTIDEPGAVSKIETVKTLIQSSEYIKKKGEIARNTGFSLLLASHVSFVIGALKFARNLS